MGAHLTPKNSSTCCAPRERGPGAPLVCVGVILSSLASEPTRSKLLVLPDSGSHFRTWQLSSGMVGPRRPIAQPPRGRSLPSGHHQAHAKISGARDPGLDCGVSRRDVLSLAIPLHTVNGQNPAPPKNIWNDDSPVNANKQWFPMQDFVSC